MRVRDISRMTLPPAACSLSIIIVTFNSSAVLPGLLDSLLAALEGIDTFETIVLDNDSHDDCIDIALAHAVRPKVIRMGRNAGYAAAINAGAATVSPDADLLILNPDVRLLSGSVSLLVDRLKDPSVGVAVPQMLTADGSTFWSLRREPSVTTAWADAILGGTLASRLGKGQTIGDPAVYDREGPIEWATGAVLAVSARARHLIGNWDESFFLYMEEVDYLRRVRDLGFSVTYVPEAKAVHIGGEYSENPALSALLCANRIRYHRRHHGPISTAAFRLSIVVGEGLRAFRAAPGHRAAVRAAFAPWTLPSEYRERHSTRRDAPDASPKPAKSRQSQSTIGIERC